MNAISSVLKNIFIMCFFILTSKNFCAKNSFGAHYHYKGRYTDDIRNSVIVFPQRVNKDGFFLSHVVAHQHSKRSAEETELVFYKIPIEGKEYLIELTPNKKLISPGAIVETHKINSEFKNLSFTRTTNNKSGNMFKNLNIRKLKNTECHFSGHVKGENISKAALSTCNGLAGFIQIDKGLYTIEPVAEHDPLVDEVFPHILYKTSNLENNTVCKITEGISSLLNNQNLRKKREINISSLGPMFIETLVVMDKSLINFHKESDCENYILTVFNMAFNLFHDVSLDLMISPTIVRIIRLEVENVEMNLKKNTDAVKTLKYFQTWQYEINPGDDSHPNHHDVAILVTRVNICYSSNSCGLLGLSTIGKACDPKYSAALCEDNGLRLGFVIAHEIGHLMGADHDSYSPCNDADTKGLRTIMHPQISINSQTWSKCSQAHFKAFFRSGLGNCFLDEPEDHQFNVQDLLPGVMYNADFQCRHLITVNARECDRGSSCDSLNCFVPGYACILTHTFPAEGTFCGEGMWCHDEKCIMMGQRPGAVDGNWGEWSSWSDCTRTCGSGISSSVRLCNKPIPSHGGKNCMGERKRYKVCATTPCKTGRPSFRDVQCGEFNDWVYPEDGKTHTWKAFYQHEDDPCKLFCINEKNSIAALKPRVVDGTMCYRGIRDICVGGTCKTLPCDLHFESNAIEDACGVCHGDGTACEFSSGTENFSNSSSGIIKLLEVPTGTRNIKVEEISASLAKIVVKDKESKEIYIKGTTLGMYRVPGSQAWLGMIKKNSVTLNIPGPIAKSISIWVEKPENTKTTIKWSIALPLMQQRKPEFAWDFIKWGPCSAKCGPGTQKSEPSCMEEIAGLVENTFCSDLEMPPAKIRPCEITICEPRWMVGDWKVCENSAKMRKRAVYCIKAMGEGEGESQIVSDSECIEAKPHDTEPCEIRQKRDDTDDSFFDDSMFIQDIVEFGFHKKYNDYLTHFAALSVPQRKSETVPLHLLSSPHFKHYFRVLEIPESNINGDTEFDFSNNTVFDRRNRNKISPDFYKNTFSGNPIDVSHMQSQFISIKARKNAPILKNNIFQNAQNINESKINKLVLGSRIHCSKRNDLKCLLKKRKRKSPKIIGHLYLNKAYKIKTTPDSNEIYAINKKNNKNHRFAAGFSSRYNTFKYPRRIRKYVKKKNFALKSKRIRHSLRNLFPKKKIKNFNYTSPDLTDWVNNIFCDKINTKNRFLNLIQKKGRCQKLHEGKELEENGSPWNYMNLGCVRDEPAGPQEIFVKNYNRINTDFFKNKPIKTSRLNQEFDGSGIRKMDKVLNKLNESSEINNHNNDVVNVTENYSTKKDVLQERSYFSNPKLLKSLNAYYPKFKFKERRKSLEDLISEKAESNQHLSTLHKRNICLLLARRYFPKCADYKCKIKRCSMKHKIDKRLSHKWKKQKLKDINVKSTKDSNANGYGTETRNYLNNLFRDTRAKVATTTPEPQENSDNTVIDTGRLIIDQDPVDCQQIEVVLQDDFEKEKKENSKILPRPSPNQKLSLKGQQVFDLYQKLQLINENTFKNNSEEDTDDQENRKK